MNVLLLNWLDRENPRAGGAEVHLHETFGRLVEAGWRVSLVASGWRGGNRTALLDGIDVRRVGTRYTYPAAAFRQVREMLATGAFDLTVEDLNKAPLLSPLWTPGPHVLLVHHLFGAMGFLGASIPVALATWGLERTISRAYHATPIVAVSESTRQDLMDQGLPGSRITVVENGVDTVRYSPGIADDRFPEPTLLYLGRLKRYKRVDLILEALAGLRGSGLGVRLLVAGDGEDATRLRRIARRLALGSDAVSFLGFVSEEEKATLLRRAWVHVLTSTKEGWGISNLEAAASGTPSVSSDAPGLRDSVVDGATGFLVPHGDVEALVGRLRTLIRDGDLRVRLGSGARTFALQFSWERTADRLGSLMESAVASPRAES